jgi:hypothetical protein
MKLHSAHPALALCLMVTVSGCSTLSDKPDASTGRTLPAPPAFLAPVALPEIAKGADTRVVLGRYRQQLIKANRRLSDGRTWYIQTKAEYGR